MISAEQLVAIETCNRRFAWTGRYVTRVSLVRALYMALDAGLRSESDPERAAENELLSLAAKPGLDVSGQDIYAIAMHHAKLAALVVVALRSAYANPWTPIEPLTLPSGSKWTSACYDVGDGKPRRIALVDNWTDARKQSETFGWRTVGEVAALDRAIIVTAIVIGGTQKGRRHSPWTRCYRHPRNGTYRMQRKTAEEDFSQTWQRMWREDSEIKTEAWLDRMHEDGCMTDLVHSIEVPVPRDKKVYLEQMERLAEMMSALPETPDMRLAGCFGFSPCPFVGVCPHDDPARFGFALREQT